MKDLRVPPQDVPVLTEVVDAGGAEPVPTNTGVVLPLRAFNDVRDDVAAPSGAPHAPTDIDTDALTQEVLAEVQRQVNRMAEYRLRDALSPMLEKVARDFVAAAREELASTVHDIVRKAVTQALARRRNNDLGR